jgi:CRP/FNR family cyclic AMP-dependent transcriptional regulator
VLQPRLPGWLTFIRDAEHARRAAILARTPVFAGLSRRVLGRLAAQLFEKAYAPGELVFREGDPGKGLFVVLDGEVIIVRDAAEGEQTLVTVGAGAAFGELALIDDLPRSATARVTRSTRLLILYRTHFEGLVEGDRAVALAITRNLLRLLAGYVRTFPRLARPATLAAPAAAPSPGAAGSEAPPGPAAASPTTIVSVAAPATAVAVTPPAAGSPEGSARPATPAAR